MINPLHDWFASGSGVYASTDLDRLRTAPSVEAFNRMTERALKSLPPLYLRPLAETRAERSAWSGRGSSKSANWITIHSTSGSCRARLICGTAPRALCLHAHGGGWVLGGADQQDPWLETLAAAGFAVLSVDYRLAPESPFPGALHDVTAVLEWLLEQGAATLHLDCRQIVLCGESAGANLLVGALNRLKRHPAFTVVRAVGLHYGTYDLRGSHGLRAAPVGTPFLDWPLADWFCRHYGADHLREHPEVSPLLADLSGLPQALLVVGSDDPVLEDTLLMESRWRTAGSRATAAVVAGGLHGMLEHRTPVTDFARRLVVRGLTLACEA
ncbi:alpha/beta hydrolase [Panacagrimonas sp.]|uniref:alpha/beta hydrolase n=1 Tax=Panacagrimonas sp. TaxID=2480088 RepID=UPI003B52C5F6